MGCLAAALQPNTRTRSNSSGWKPDPVIATNLDDTSRRLLGLGRRVHQPAVLPHKAGLAGGDLGQKMPSALEHVNVGSPLVTCGADDKIHVHIFLFQGAVCGGRARKQRDLETETLAIVLGRDDVPPSQDTVGPFLLVRPKGALLVVHDLEEVLDELQPDDTVVGGTGVGEKVGPVCGGLGVNGVDELGVKDGVDTTGVSSVFE